MRERIEQLLQAQAWARPWVLGPDGKLPGMICVQSGGMAYELKEKDSDPALTCTWTGKKIPRDVTAVGCGGWDLDGILRWIGIDLDVKEGHSEKIVKQTYPTSAEAIEAARSVRDFVNGAAEIRLSKSGVGVHCRVVTQAIANGRIAGKELGIAAHAVKHLIRAVGIKCDTTVQGRQNLWFWASSPGPRGFELIEAAEPGASWRIPSAWQKEPPVLVQAPAAPAPRKQPTPVSAAGGGGPFRTTMGAVRSDYDRAAAYVDKIPGEGSGGRNKTLYALGKYVLENFLISEGEFTALLLGWSLKCSPPIPDDEARKTITSSWRKSHADGIVGSKRREWLPAGSGRPLTEPGGAETIVDVDSFAPFSNSPAAEGPQVGGKAQRGLKGETESKEGSPSSNGCEEVSTDSSGGEPLDSGPIPNNEEPELVLQSDGPPGEAELDGFDRRGPRRVSKGRELPVGAAAEWLNEDFYLDVNMIAKMDIGTKRDEKAMELFRRIADNIVGAPTVTMATVKDVVCRKLKIGRADFNRALREAQADLRRERGEMNGEGDDADFVGLARAWVHWLAYGDADSGARPSSPRRVIKRWREAWYLWEVKTGYYQQKSNEWARARATEFLERSGVPVGTNTVSNFLEALRGRVFLDDDVRPPCWLEENEFGELHGDALHDPNAPVWISMKNGVLCLTSESNAQQTSQDWLQGLKLHAHSPNFWCLNSLPYEFDPKATCPDFQDALCLWQPPERAGDGTIVIQLIQDWFGYILTPGQREQKILMNIGPGGDGKSQLTTIMRAVAGERNCSAVGLEAFDPKREFGLQPLLGKTLNITGDASEIERMSEGIIKQISGGDPITVNRKNKDMITDVLSVKFVVNANQLPFFRDKSEGIWRRFLVVNWQPVPIEKVEKEFAQRLIRTEIAGIFNWALEGFRRVRAQGFNVAGLLTENIKEAREEIQHELKFFHERIRIDEKSDVFTDELMGAYKAWCTANNVKAALYPGNLGKSLRKWMRDQMRGSGVDEAKIRATMEALIGRQSRRSDDNQRRREFYRGISLRCDVGEVSE